jgi:hypothetical protein
VLLLHHLRHHLWQLIVVLLVLVLHLLLLPLLLLHLLVLLLQLLLLRVGCCSRLLKPVGQEVHVLHQSAGLQRLLLLLLHGGLCRAATRLPLATTHLHGLPCPRPCLLLLLLGCCWHTTAAAGHPKQGHQLQAILWPQ